MTDLPKHKIGVFGGTLDPLHIGHLIIAQAALEELGLEKVVFIPSGRPPHKANRVGAADYQRIEMLKSALEGDPRFEIDLIEIGSEEYTYSYVTMRKLTEMHPENDYYFIVGEDSLRDLNRWRNPEILAGCCTIAAAGRKGFSDISIDELIMKRQEELGGRIVHIECPVIDLSSSEIRKRVSEGRSVKYFSPDCIEEYIKENGLYKNV